MVAIAPAPDSTLSKPAKGVRACLILAEKITNLRAWLTRLTHNLCIDIHRERRRKAMQMEDIEEIAATGNSAFISGLENKDTIK